MDLNRASNVDEQYLKSQLRKIARDIVGVEQRINVIERASQAPYRSVSNGNTVYYDENGEVRQIVGVQPDGTYTSVEVNGPPAPSPPSRPIIETRTGSVIVTWDGKMENGSTLWPADFDHVEVHIATDEFFAVDDSTEIATYNTLAGGSISISLEPDTYYWVKLVQVNKSGVRSLESEEVNFFIEEIPYGIKTYRQDNAPTGLTTKEFGAIWYDTNDGNRQRFWDGTQWVDVSSESIEDALQAAEDALAEAQQRVKLSYAATRPTGLFGDDRVLWMDPNNGYAAEFWNGISWSPYFFGSEAVGFDARDIGGILTSVGLAPPSSPIAGDIWYNTSQNNRPEVWDGTQWVIVRDGTIAAASVQAAQAIADASAALTAAQAAQATADGSIRTYYQSNPPWANGSTQPASSLGDMWFDQDDGQAYRWNGTTWVIIEDSSIAVALAAAQNAQSTADGKINSYYSTTAPTLNGEGETLSSADTGDLWFDTDDGNKTSYWTGTAWAALPTGRGGLATDVITSIDSSVKTYVIEYSVNASETVAPTTGWSTAQPTRTAGTFVWFRATVTRNDNTTSTTSPALMTGNTGAPGANAPAIALTATTQVLVSPPAGGATTPATSTVTGAAVNTTITAWDYSVDGATFSATVPAGVSRTGNVVTITGSTMTARTIAVRMGNGAGISDTLTVAKVLDGAAGSTGGTGAAGADAYTVLLTNEAQTFAGSTTAALADSTSSQVIAYKGAVAQTATIGTITGQVTGLTTAITNNGTTTAGFTVTVTTALTQQTGTLSVPVTVGGITFTKIFSWTVTRTGATGSQGIQGPVGPNGATLYTWLKYADTPTTGMSDLPTGKTYMGIAYNKSSATESSIYSDYEWSLIQGPQGNQGIQGPAGANGQPTYTWIKYGDSAAGAGLSDLPAGKTYIGIAYNKTTQTESSLASDYEWSLIQGPQGPAGANAATISLTATAQILTVPATGGATSPTTAVVTGTPVNTTITAWTYSVDGAAFSATVPTGVSRTGDVVTVTGATVTARTIAIRAADANGVADTLTVAKVSDGATGGTGGTGPAGADAYTVLLTNEAHTFIGSTTAAVGGSTTTSVIAYKGGTQIAATVGTVTGQVTGLTTAIVNNGTTTAGVTVTVTSALTQQNGTLTIPLTVDGKSFTKTFAWSVTRAGVAGAAAPIVSLTATSQALIVPAGGGATTPATSIVTGAATNTTITVWEYSVDGAAFSATVPAGASRTGNVVTITGSTMTARTITVRMADANGVADTLTVAKVADGATGATGGTGPAGADAYTVLLTNEAHTFAGTTTAAVGEVTTTSVIAYKGGTQIAATVGTITGQVTGLTTAVVNNGTTTAGVTVTVTSALTQQNGMLTIPLTVDGKSFTKTFAWSVSRAGAAGAAAPVVSLTTTSQALVAPAAGGATTPATATVTGTATNTTITVWEYSVDGGAFSATVPLGASRTGNVVTITGATMTARTITVRMADANGVADTLTVAEISNGATGGTGGTGAAGADAYTVLLTNEATVFPGSTTAALAGSTTSQILAYKGTAPIAATIGTITGQVTGLTTAITNNGTTTAGFTVTVTTALTATSGELTVPVTVDGITFTKKFTWTVSRAGAAGANGSPAPLVYLTGTAQALVSPPGGGTTTPATSTVTGASVNTTITVWDYSVDGAAFSTTVPAGVSRSGNVVTVTGSTMTARTITVRMLDAAGVSDTMTVAKILDGASGGTGSTGPAGADAYTVLLTNEANVFAGSTTAALAGSTTSQVIAYKGATQIAATIGTITGQVTGLTTALTNNGTTTAGFTVTVTTALTATSGELVVPVTVDGQSFTKRFSWTVGRAGATGATGSTGVSVTSITPYYAQVTTGAATPATPVIATPPAPWTSTEPVYTANTELYRVEKITFSDGSFSYTTVFKSSSYDAASAANAAALAAAGLAAGKGRVYYQTAAPAVPTVENLIPNPSAEATATPTTIFTNLATNPLPTSLTGFTIANGSTVAYEAGTASIRVTIPSGGVVDAGVNMAGLLGAVVAGTYTYSVEIEAVTAFAARISVQGAVGAGNSTAVAFTAGEIKRISYTIAHTGAGTPSVYILRNDTNATDFRVRKIMKTLTPVAPADYFDGSTRNGYFNDPDFTTAWSGTANASTSVVQGIPVASTLLPPNWNIVGENGIRAIRSSKWAKSGTYSIRVIPVTSNIDSFLNFTYPAGQDGKSFVVKASLHLEAPLTGTLDGRARRLLSYDVGTTQSTQAPNTAGNTEHTIAFTSGGTIRNVRLYHGGAMGSGDVWYDALFLAETTDQTVVPFSGATADDAVYTYRWTGTANASTSKRYTVAAQQDLWIDTDDGNKPYRWDGGAWVAVTDQVAIDAAAAAAAAQATADSKITTYAGATDPAVAARAGDMWLKPETANGVSVNVLYRRNDTDTAWVRVDDPAAQQAIADAAAAAQLADGKMKIYPQTAAPTGLTASDNGDLWIDTDDGNKTYRYVHGSTAGTNGAGGAGPWISILDTSLASIQYVDQQILTSASGKNKTTYSTGVPGTTTNTAGDIWFQYNGSNQIIGQWRGTGGTSWTAVTLENSVIATIDAAKINTGFLDVANRINAGAIAIGKVANLQTSLDSKVSTFTTTGASPTTPTALTAGDIWIHTNNGLTKIYRATAAGTASWVIVADDTATPTTFVQSAIPTSVAAGDVWIDTDDGKMYRAAVAGATTIAAGAWILFNDPATSGNKNFSQGTVPTSTALGDIWVNTSDNNKIYVANAAGVSTIVTTGNGWYLRSDLTTKTRTYMQTAVPTSAAAGDSWIDTDDNNKLYVANAAGVSTIVTTGNGWYLVQDAAGARTGAMQDIQTLWGMPGNTTFIDGGDIYTNTVRARQLMLMDVNNYLSDPNFIDNTAQSWEFGAGAGIVLSSGPTVPGYLSMNAAAINTNLHTGDASFWATEPGTEYLITGEFSGSASNTGTTTFYPALQVHNSSNLTITWPQTSYSVGTSTTWTPFELRVTMPANSARFRWHGFVNATVLNNKVFVRGIKIRRKNAGSLIVDGSIEAGKLGANSVIAANIVSGEVTADALSSDAIDGKTITGAVIRTAAAGKRLELTTSGLIQLDSNNNVILSIGDQNKFTGEVEATGIIIRDSLQLFGRSNLFATGSKVTLKASAGNPSQSPTLSWQYEAGPTITDGQYWFPTAVHSVNGVFHSATYVFLNQSQFKRADGKYWLFPQITKPGAPTETQAEFKPWGMVRIAKSDTGAERVVMVGEDYTHPDTNNYPETWIRVYDDSTMNTSGTGAPVLKASWKVADFSWFLQYRLGRHINGTTDREKFIFISLSDPGNGTNKTLKMNHYGWNNTDNGYTLYSANNYGAVVGNGETLGGGVIGARSALNLDNGTTGSSTDFMMVVPLLSTNAVYNITTASWEFDSYWPTTWNTPDRMWTDGDNVAGTMTNFYTFNFSTGTSVSTWKYSNNRKRVSTNIWASYAWVGEASSSFKTIASPIASIPYRSGAQLRVTMPALPAPIAGVGAARDPAKDTYGWQYYVAYGSTAPTNLYLGPTNPTLAPNTALAVSSAILGTFPTNTGALPVAASTFPSSSPATIESDNGLLSINGDGKITADELLGNAVDRLLDLFLPPGTMITSADDVAPYRTLICDGSAVSRTTYSVLFSKIGTTYGVGNGSTTFNLPRMQGRSPIGVGAADTGSAGNNYALGLKWGHESLQQHNHPVTDPGHGHGVNDPWHSHGLSYGIDGFYGWTLTGGGTAGFWNNSIGAANTAGAPTGVTVNGNTTGVTTQNNGSGNAGNVHPVLALNFYIRY